MATRAVSLPGVDLHATLWPVLRWRADPTSAVGPRWFARAVRTPIGPGTVRACWDDAGTVRAEAWGAGASWLLDGLPALLGAHDDPADFAPRHPLVARLHHDQQGLRLNRTGAVWNEAALAVVEQRVTTADAARSWARLVRAWGEPAPGPAGLVVPPAPEVVAGAPYWAFHPFGVERRRADTARRLARRAARLHGLATRPPEEARTALQRIDGIGPWTAAEVVASTHGDPDTVLLGDAGLPRIVGWALARERDADDARMLELLEPFAGHRWRVVRLLMAGGVAPARRRPLPPRNPIDRW